MLRGGTKPDFSRGVSRIPQDHDSECMHDSQPYRISSHISPWVLLLGWQPSNPDVPLMTMLLQM